MTIEFDPATVRALADILVEAGLTEIEVETKEGSIRVARAPATIATTVPAMAASAPLAAAPEAAEPASDNTVSSPMVGIAYLSAEPGTAPFVTVGQTVAVGQTLLLIEAMKTFNQIKSPRAGVVSRILIASGAPVEFGEPLLVIG